MDYKKLSDAIRLCGSTQKIHECKEKCPYYAGGDMMKCIPVMTKDVADMIYVQGNMIEDAKRIFDGVSIGYDLYDGFAQQRPIKNTTKKEAYTAAGHAQTLFGLLVEHFIKEYIRDKKLIKQGQAKEFSQETKDSALMVAACLAYRKKIGNKRIWETRGLWVTSIAFEVIGFNDPEEFYIVEEQNGT